MKRPWRDELGVTLVETLVGVGVLTLMTSTIGISLFQSVLTDQRVVDDGLAINELRKGLAWFAGDVKMASSADLVDGGAPAPAIAIAWTDQFEGAGTPHSASYTLVNDTLVRTYDGVSHVVARRVVTASFSRSGRAIVAQFQVDGEPGQTRTLSVRTLMRPSI